MLLWYLYIITGSQHKEQMFKNLYERLCTEIEKEENVSTYRYQAKI